MAGKRIIGQRRVIGLLTFFATPLVLVAAPGDVFVSFVVAMLLGISMLFADRCRAAGVGLLTGTIATLGAVLLIAAISVEWTDTTDEPVSTR